MKSELKVAVWMVTCNHEKFIKKAIEGILEQQTTFNFELFIGVDYSQDLTKEICLKYQKEFPDLINLTIMEANIGATMNGINTYLECFKSNAKYIALCEGDDYWTDPLKLQKQVDFLETNNDFSICFHRAYLLKGSEMEEDYITTKFSDVTTIDDLITKGNFINTATVVFRNKLPNFPIQFNTTPIGDYFLYILLTDDGSKLKFIDEYMAAYRYGIGIHSSKKRIEKLWEWYEMLILIQSCVLNHSSLFVKKIKSFREVIEQEVHIFTSNNDIIHKFTFKKFIKSLINRLRHKLTLF